MIHKVDQKDQFLGIKYEFKNHFICKIWSDLTEMIYCIPKISTYVL